MLLPRTVLAALAGAVSSRSAPDDPVTLVLPWTASRCSLTTVRRAAQAARRRGLEVRVETWPAGWRTHGVLVLTGPHTTLGGWYLLWRRATGIP